MHILKNRPFLWPLPVSSQFVEGFRNCLQKNKTPETIKFLMSYFRRPIPDPAMVNRLNLKVCFRLKPEQCFHVAHHWGTKINFILIITLYIVVVNYILSIYCISIFSAFPIHTSHVWWNKIAVCCRFPPRIGTYFQAVPGTICQGLFNHINQFIKRLLFFSPASLLLPLNGVYYK